MKTYPLVELANDGLLSYSLRRNGGSVEDFLEKHSHLVDVSFHCAYTLIERYAKRHNIRALRGMIESVDTKWPEFVKPDNHDEVAVLLPETGDNDHPYRISRYDTHGPKSHECFNKRLDAYQWMLDNGFTLFKPGSLDALTDSDSWYRGLFICECRSKQIHPAEALKHTTDKRLLAIFSE